MQTTISMLVELQQLLDTATPVRDDKKVFVGFDGFVDKIKRAVKARQETGTVYFESIREFSERISLASGKSGQIQMDIQRTKLGGNAPILSDTLGKLGIQTFCLGSMGYPKQNDVFSGMSALSETISVLEPGHSDAVEFSDGKIIFSELEMFDNYNWAHIRKTAGLERLQKAVSESSLLAFVDWANLPHASDIWKGMLNDVIKPSGRKNFLFLFDLCDPSKKTTGQIDEVLDLIGCFSLYGSVMLGLNENETRKLWSSVNRIDFSDMRNQNKIPPVLEAGDFLYKMMDIESLLVHPVDRSILFQQHATIELPGRLVTKPRVQTGGGDNLNAGYCLGWLSGYTSPQCMLLGMVASGAYIENGTSPDRQDLHRYLNVWINDLKKQETTPAAHAVTRS